MPRLLTLIWQALLKLVGQQSATDRRLIDLLASVEVLHTLYESQQQLILAWKVEAARDHARLAELLGMILEAITPEPATQLKFSAILDDGTVLEDLTMLEMTYTQKATLTLAAVDSKGKPAVLDGVPEWLSGNTDLVTVVPSSDGMSAEAVAVGAIGEGKITVTADAKLGPDVKPIIGSLDFRITPGEATQITVTAGTPVEQEG